MCHVENRKRSNMDQGDIFDRFVKEGLSDEAIAEIYTEEDTVELLVALTRIRGRRLKEKEAPTSP
jgi:hypothetical protein